MLCPEAPHRIEPRDDLSLLGTERSLTMRNAICERLKVVFDPLHEAGLGALVPCSARAEQGMIGLEPDYSRRPLTLNLEETQRVAKSTKTSERKDVLLDREPARISFLRLRVFHDSISGGAVVRGFNVTPRRTGAYRLGLRENAWGPGGFSADHRCSCSMPTIYLYHNVFHYYVRGFPKTGPISEDAERAALTRARLSGAIVYFSGLSRY